MPIAGNNMTGAAWQEGLIKAGLGTLSVAMVTLSVLALWGLRGRRIDVGVVENAS